MNNDFLVLANQRDYTVLPFMGVDCIDLDYAFKNLNKMMKIFRRMWYMLGLPGFSIWSNISSMDISRYKIIVLFECSYPLQAIKIIREKNKKCRIIYWLWNPIKEDRDRFYSKFSIMRDLIEKQNLYNFSIATFDKKDAEKYNFAYLNQVAPYLYDNGRKIIRDVVFIGRDKGRYETIKKISDLIMKMERKIKVVLVEEKEKNNTPKYMEIKDSEMPYNIVVNYILESKCILDITQKGQRGITWRPLEALFYKKKLITNFREIKAYDFYSPNNIFVLGEDDDNLLQSFLDGDMDDVDESVIDKYKADNWVNKLREQFL